MKPASQIRDFTPGSFTSFKSLSLSSEGKTHQSNLQEKVLTPKTKTMKTFVPFQQIILKSVLFIFASAFCLFSQASTLQNLADSTTDVPVINAGRYSSTSFQVADQVTAVLNNNKVDLKWVTAAEINLSHFIIEKSIDGKNFSDAGVVFAYGNATDKTTYSFTDKLNAEQPAVIYYIIRSVDVDGKSQYSETRTIRGGMQTEKGIVLVTSPK